MYTIFLCWCKEISLQQHGNRDVLLWNIYLPISSSSEFPEIRVERHMLDILFLQVSFIKWLQRWAMDTATIRSMSTPVKKCVVYALLWNEWFATHSYNAYLFILIVLFPFLVLLSYGDTEWYYVLEQSTSVSKNIVIWDSTYLINWSVLSQNT